LPLWQKSANTKGQGIITTGSLVNGRFIATEVLAKHDENYMPPEVADALVYALLSY
jgi:cytochrome c-type biogenesis protein CcmE